MNATSFIFNHTGQHLDHVLLQGLTTATRADIGVAFVTETGLARVRDGFRDLVARQASIRLLVGTDLWLTEPEPLRWLVRELAMTPHGQLYLVDPNSQEMFHPKIYLFELEDTATVVVGSSNLTAGGLANNVEGDLVVKLSPSDPIVSNIRAMFDTVIQSGRAKLAGLFSVGEYARLHAVYHRHLDPAVKAAQKAAQQELAGQVTGFNEQRIRRLMEEYLADPKEQRDYARRTHNYQVARRSLDQIASEATDSDAKFAVLYSALVAGPGNEGAWHSGSLFRHKNQVIPQWQEVMTVVRFVRDHPELAPREMFAEVKRLAAPVFGLGINVPTEIMNTYYPARHAVLNQNPRTSLVQLGVSARYPEPNSFDADDYDRFVKDIGYIKDLGGFDSMGQADHFLNYIYWRFVNPQK